MLSPLAAGFGWGKAKQEQERAEKEEADARARGESPPPTSWWANKAAVGLGALAVAAAGSAVYYRREDLATGWKWGAEHMTFVRNLWDADALKARLERIAELQETRNVSFAK